ncbi:CPBP family intramembrane metalloprotease [Tychonema sp. LEGE 07199]|uniref:CPBP family intramembrane glutamic endopeptidase n=1 Tax=unclassified Tychonema TaxID=2642144 RepID=UPI00187F0F2D|nr:MULTISPECIES: type II CAAX endopeptidase family protein [unclassified Tychonema]MBE9121328.1 CPBP family intramembrane metalloprotease [Tychonema sp. LEGE 07199]MBE9134231.1 CPBP family intramembrane metalloprotease [Tychonema sp. LEGE 07196]
MITAHKIANYPFLLRVIIFLFILAAIWLPVAAPIYLLVKDSNLATILTMGLLFVEFLFLVRRWGKQVYGQTQLLKSYGLVNTRQNGFELLTGLAIGTFITFTLFLVQGLFGFVAWQNSDNLPRIIAEGLLSALGVGFAEELVFRGWLLDELQRDYNNQISVRANSLVFALSHFIKSVEAMLRSWPQFPGLLLLGLILVFAKRSRQNRLGLSIGLHAGLVWGYYIINIGELVRYSGSVPDWVTGINGNPLAGAVGLLFLSVLAVGMRKISQ